MGMRKGWLYTREEIMWFVKNNSKFIWNKEEQYNLLEYRPNKKKFFGGEPISKYNRYTNIWTDITEESFNTKYKSFKNIGHFTPKPIQSIERIIKLHSKEDDIVLDCFGGSGTTAIACINLNRNYILIEKDKEIFSIAQNRIKEHLEKLKC
jgi:site-specific DNA-methyltransferase (adenine-specific)